MNREIKWKESNEKGVIQNNLKNEKLFRTVSTRALETMKTLSFSTFILVLEMFHCG